ncbi:SGNH/GDSL hydrolase family protein [Natronosporangium hydrolyticum]|uniref:SGNH/GDSL hydrolase family protein n=1 Tax=Natronosporangium hydrolyticum TaxID=2811111 RepID=A0A895Y8T5_9ACTN|nr:SGNH/GDSL hydrolase family protein [Natronosporangium hydrolyticum]QSB12725.1 SGNH/GDSL hydrolase family protein [Natronosporangium hydrolyticum]
MRTLVRRLSAVCAAAAIAMVTVVTVASPAAAQAGPPPDSMASMGDSITRGFNACGFYVDCTSRSFSTGSSAGDSHYQRILEINPAISGNNTNAARSGARVAEMSDQAQTVVASGAEYVTILIGANDACTSSESSMTPVADFRGHIDDALQVLATGLPDAQVMVISIPDIKQLWQAGRGNLLARSAWSLFNICQSMLANPTSNAAADVERRDRVQQRVIDYNSELEAACAAYGANCAFDDNVVFNYPFSLSQVSGWDYFHPNNAGQQVLAEISYEAGFNW